MSKKLFPFSFENNPISVGARSSPLSLRQVTEVLEEMRQIYPFLQFTTVSVTTFGDIDLISSLRSLGKTDFFTREIDEMLLKGHCRVAIHSAKDLPEPMPQGLSIVAITQGRSPFDVLVLKKGHDIDVLPKEPKIGSSSLRRDESVKRMLKDAICFDIRGTIETRLASLDEGKYDGIVLALAALIRLGIKEYPYVILPGEYHPMQGRLAVVARENDDEMRRLFAPIHAEATVFGSRS